MNELRIKLASKLLGENVTDILEKTESFKKETVRMKSNLKDKLRAQNAVTLEIKDSQDHLNNLLAQIKTAQQELDEKKIYGDLLDDISAKETSIDAKESDIEKENLRIDEQKQNLNTLKVDVTSLKDRKAKLNQEKEELQGKTVISEEELELQSVNSDISDYQKWLREHSPELDTIKTKIEQRIQEIEESSPEGPQTPPEKPKDKKPQKPKDVDKSPEEGKSGIPPKKELQEGSSGDSVEPKVRKKRNHQIKEIYDLATGETIIAEDFFSNDINYLINQRNIFQDYISQGKRRFVCPKCYEMIRISGRGDERGLPCIFTHKNDSVYCARTTTGLSKEEIERRKYGLFGQSERHKQLKKELFDYLSDINSVALGVQNVEMEKRVYSSLPFFNFRQPDVQIEYEGKKIVFEIQLSTTFLSVISERDTFYRLNGYYIIWVFNFEDNKKYVDLNNLAMKDIYFANKRNAFIFDEDARQWSRERKQLVLKCNWLEPDLTWHYKNTSDHFGGEPVTLDQLNYDSDTFKPYLKDAEKAYFDVHPEKVDQLISELKSREEKIKELEEQAQDRDVNRREAIELIKEAGGTVISFEEKKRFGFKYGVTVIIDPKFTFCMRQENGTFIVGFNRKKGLVNQYGEMLRECEYIDIHPLSGSAYLAEGRECFWLCNIKEAFRERIAGDYALREMIRERVERVKLYHRDTEDAFCIFYIIDGQKILARIGDSTVFVDLDGNRIVDDEFLKLKFQANDFVQVQRKSDSLWNTMSFDGVFDGEWTTDRPSIPLEHGLTLIYKGDCQGVKDKDGNVIVEPTYTEILANSLIPFLILKDVRTERYYWQTHTISLYSLVALNGTKEGIPEKYQRTFPIIGFIDHNKMLIGDDTVRLPDFNVLASGCNIIKELDNGYLIVSKRKEQGLNDPNGEVIIPCEYASVNLWNDDIYICKSEKKYGYYSTSASYCLINSKGETIQNEFETIGNIIDGKAKVTKNGEEGELDAQGQIIITEQKDLTSGLKGKKYLGRWELSNSDGDIVRGWDDNVSNIESLNEDLSIIEINNRKGIIDSKGKTVLPCRYVSVSLWTSGIFKVGTENNRRLEFILLDGSAKIISPLAFDSIGELTDNKASVSLNGFDGLIDNKGQMIPSETKELECGLLGRKYLGFWEIVDSNGNVVSDWNKGITQIDNFKEDSVLILKGELYGLLDHTGKTILPCQYGHISVWAKSILLVSKTASTSIYYRLCYENGKMVNSHEYTQIDELKDGKACVKIGTYTGFIDENGNHLPDNEIILSDGNIKYSILGKWGIRSPQGKSIIKCTNDEITSYKGYYVVIKSSEVEKSNIATTNVIPVTGVKSGTTEKSIIFNVAGKGFLVSKSVAEKKWRDEIPQKAELIIMNLCSTKNRYSWIKKKVSVIAKPYSEKRIQKRETAINEYVQGIVTWVNYGSAIVKLDDGCTVFVHKSNFKEVKLDKNYKGRKIEIKKIGVDSEHQKDVWEILNIESSVE